MSKIIPIVKDKPKFILVVNDYHSGLYYYLTNNIARSIYSKSDIGVWHVKYKTKLDN